MERVPYRFPRTSFRPPQLPPDFDYAKSVQARTVPARLVEALWSRSNLHRAKYATGGEVDAAAYRMPTSIHVDGAGDLALPISHNDLLKLKAVSTAQGIDASMVSCPQIPDFFSKVARDLAGAAMAELGIDADALGLEVKLERLSVSEQGGQFPAFQKKEVAMMILQLPTESGHSGGQLEIRQGKEQFTCDFAGARSRTSYFSTVFFCDCEHKMAEVTHGTKLCLAFSLVKMDMDPAVESTSYIFALERVQKLFKEWVDYGSGMTLAIPLCHKYSNNSLSFAGLKGYDRVVAALVLSCTSFLDVHLCMLVRKIIEHNGHCDGDYNEPQPEIRWKLQNWSTVDGKARHFTSSLFDKKNILQHEDLVDYARCSSAAALVVWPKEKRMEALSTLQPVKNVIDLLEEQHTLDPERTCGDFQSFVAGYRLANKQDSFPHYDLLLNFCLKHDLQDAAFKFLRTWTFSFFSSPTAIVAIIRKYGWDVCYREVIQEGVENYGVAKLPMHLRENGFEDAAMCVAKKLLNTQNMSQDDAVQLTEFFTVSGLEEETWHTWSRVSDIYSKCLALVAKTWGEKSIPRIEELLERTLKEREKSWKKTAEWNVTNNSFYRPMDMPKTPVDQTRLKNELEKVEKDGRRHFLGEVAAVVLKLWDQGCGDVALALGKNWIKRVPLEELYDGADRLWDKIKNINFQCGRIRVLQMFSSERETQALMFRRMRNAAADLFGLKKDAKVTQLFASLLSKRLENAGENAPVDIDVLDTAFWLGDEKLIADIVKRAGRDPYIMESMFQKVKAARYPEDDPYEDEECNAVIVVAKVRPTEDEVLEKAKQEILTRFEHWDAAGRDGFRKIVEAKIHNFSLGGQGDDEEMNDDSDYDKQRSKRPKLNPRIERMMEDEHEERCNVEIKWLRSVLAATA